jgi:hypothetical protein
MNDALSNTSPPTKRTNIAFSAVKGGVALGCVGIFVTPLFEVIHQAWEQKAFASRSRFFTLDLKSFTWWIISDAVIGCALGTVMGALNAMSNNRLASGHTIKLENQRRQRLTVAYRNNPCVESQSSIGRT